MMSGSVNRSRTSTVLTFHSPSQVHCLKSSSIGEQSKTLLVHLDACSMGKRVRLTRAFKLPVFAYRGGRTACKPTALFD